MAQYKRVRKFDVTFLDGTKSATDLTTHLNNRLQQLINGAGGSEYLETIQTDIKYIDKSNPSLYSNTISESVTNVIEERVTQEGYTIQNTGNYPDSTVPEVKENVVVSFEKESSTSADLKPGISQTDLGLWLIYIEYDQTVQVS